MIRTLALIAMMTAAFGAAADTLEKLTRGQPKDFVKFAKRLEICNHMGGEEPYDAARNREISATLTKFRCDTIEADQEKLLKKYGNNPNMVRIVKKIENLDY